MEVITETIDVHAEDWRTVALSTDDNNPIHFDRYEQYGLKRPVCAGIYLWALAEKTARLEGRFSLPLSIDAYFINPAYEEELSLKKIYNGDDSTYIFYRPVEMKERIADFKFKKISGLEKDFEEFPKTFKTETTRIEKSRLKQFNEGMDIPDNKIIYSCFSLMQVFRSFFNKREGSFITKIAGNLCREFDLSELTTHFNIDEISFRKRLINRYIISVRNYQNSELVSVGIGQAIHKIRD